MGSWSFHPRQSVMDTTPSTVISMETSSGVESLFLPSFWLLQIKLIWTFTYNCLCEYMFSEMRKWQGIQERMMSINCLTLDQAVLEAIYTPLNFLVTKVLHHLFYIIKCSDFWANDFELGGSTSMWFFFSTNTYYRTIQSAVDWICRWGNISMMVSSSQRKLYLYRVKLYLYLYRG